MAGNTFGHIFRITTFGESHGKAIGVIVDGCPAGVEINERDIQKELDCRKPGGVLVSPRKEKDKAEILSGIFKGKTTGAPIAIVVLNTDQRGGDYKKLANIFRPGHADFTFHEKFGIYDFRGGGRASARETVGRVAAGAIAKKILAGKGISTTGHIKDEKKLIEEIKLARVQNDSVGGIVEVRVNGVPAGLGEPVFHKLSSDLAAAVMSIPAVKGVEIGDGFASALRRGSENNDSLMLKNGKIATKTNRAGGIVGGISNGEEIIIRAAFKPASSIGKEQETVDFSGNKKKIRISGRHDPCVCIRAVPVMEAMVALVILDHYLLNKISKI